MLSFTMTPKSLNICVDAQMFTIDETHANYRAIRDALRDYSNTMYASDKWLIHERIKELCDIKKFIALWTRGEVQVGAEGVLYRGQPVTGVIADRLIGMVRDGFSPEPLANFLAKVQENPAEHARNELYLWLETSSLPICEDGDFLAFKSVRDDYLSHHDGVTDNSLGAVLEMPREAVDPDRDNTCSRGFHFCSMDYLSTYRSGRTVILKVNPADVVSIPSDYSNQKGRAWRYQVIDEVKTERVADYAYNGVSVAKADAVTGVGMSDKYMAGAVDQFFDGHDSQRTAEDDACDCSDCTVDPGVSADDDANVQIFDVKLVFPDEPVNRPTTLVFDDSDFDENVTVYAYEEPPRNNHYDVVKRGRGVTLTKGDRSITLTELKAMLKEHGQRGTARLTGIPRTTIQEWIARYNLA